MDKTGIRQQVEEIATFYNNLKLPACGGSDHGIGKSNNGKNNK